MSVGQLVRPSHKSRPFGGYGTASKSKIMERKAWRNHVLNFSLSFCATQRVCFTLSASNQICKPLLYVTSERERLSCRSFARPDCVNDIMKFTTTSLTRSYDVLHWCPILLQLVPAFGIVAFAVWGLEPVLSHSRKLFLQWKDSDWRKSKTHYVYTSYLQPVLLWAGVILICRALDPISLSTDASQAVKQRVLHFIRSLSTVSALAFCISSLLKQMQKLNIEKMPSNDPRNMGFHFVGKAVYTAMWVAAVSLFMELLGFSTKKWLTAGGLGTVLLTLAGREIFTNFLSSLMIHATRPFVVNDWIQTKIEGHEVSGTVEHVGWWSPTIIRGEDQESVHIPNHKFTVNVVRNLSQKTHWRIKTHLAISHLDANKINNVVADMRKVLAKNPQIEQQRIHRRIFLEYIDTENQAFMILVSCFVRTSHFEEYLCVKEAVMLDLLRVIHHHRARLATPIRTIQNAYGEPDLEDTPFADTMFTRRRHDLYLVDTLSKIYNDANGSSLVSEEPPSRAAIILEDTNTATIRKLKVINSGLSPLKARATIDTEDGEPQEKTPKGGVLDKRTKVASKPEVELTERADAETVKSAGHVGVDAATMKSASHAGAVKDKSPNGIRSMALQPKQEVEKVHTSTQHVNMLMEENIILGVALDGMKRTLPIEEESGVAQEMMKELVAFKNGGEVPAHVKDKKDAQAIAGKDTDRSM